MRYKAYFAFVLSLVAVCLSFAQDSPTGLRIIAGSSEVPVQPEIPDALPIDSPVSRTEGVGPLSAHFFSDFVGNSTSRFRDYDYTWDFGDPGSGTWETSGKSKNVVKGAAAAHVFESPGTYSVNLTVRDHNGIVTTESYTITVLDPDIYYDGQKTTCVNPSGDSDFTGAPAGARKVSTDDLSTVTQYATAGSRVLFKRGASWTTSGLSWPNNGGPVTIGAYGTGNKPAITLTADNNIFYMDYKQDWRIMDLRLVESTRQYYTINGLINMQRLLFMDLEIEGGRRGITWGHYNVDPPMMKQDIAIVDCDVSDTYGVVVMGGAERLAILGNTIADSQISHVLRVPVGYKSVIAHNDISGADLVNKGRHALKMHSSASVSDTPSPGTSEVRHYTEFSIVADNVFGGSGPWPVVIGPEDAIKYEPVLNIIVERNRVIEDHGTPNSRKVDVGFNIEGSHCTVRNNVIFGSNTGVLVQKQGISPAPDGNEIYNNTIYNTENPSFALVGVRISAPAINTIIRNNLVSFPNAANAVLIDNASADLMESNNLLTDAPGLLDPNNAFPLSRDFSLQPGSPAIDTGTIVPVFDDFEGNPRPNNGIHDVGAIERQ